MAAARKELLLDVQLLFSAARMMDRQLRRLHVCMVFFQLLRKAAKVPAPRALHLAGRLLLRVEHAERVPDRVRRIQASFSTALNEQGREPLPPAHQPMAAVELAL